MFWEGSGSPGEDLSREAYAAGPRAFGWRSFQQLSNQKTCWSSLVFLPFLFPFPLLPSFPSSLSSLLPVVLFQDKAPCSDSRKTLNFRSSQDFRFAPSHLAYAAIGMEPRAACTLGKHPACGDSFPASGALCPLRFGNSPAKGRFPLALTFSTYLF